MKAKSVLLVCFLFAAIFSSSLVGYLYGVSVAGEETAPQNTVQVKKDITPVRTEAPSEKALAPEEKTSLPVEKTSPPAETTAKEPPKPTYILREESGKIALFTKTADGKEELHSSYEVPIVFLPKSDRELLQKGLEFGSIEEIKKFVEDYVG